MRLVKVCTSLWAMQPVCSQSGVKLPMIRFARWWRGQGYDGMAIDKEASDVAVIHAVRPFLMTKDFGATFVDVIGPVMPLAINNRVQG